MPNFSSPDKGKGPFVGMDSPLNAQVPSADPQSAMFKNMPLPVSKPGDPLGILPGGE